MKTFKNSAMAHFRIGAVALAALMVQAGSAMAGLEFCNNASSKVQIAVGYNDNGDWVSEGWWGLQPDECYTPTPVRGDLTNRYYYYYAHTTNGDGVWAGDEERGYLFCTNDEPFTLLDGDCADRGYEEQSFLRVDTGERAKDFTVELEE